MRVALRWIRFALSGLMLVITIIAACYHQTTIYLLYQARGQVAVLTGSSTIQEYRKENPLSTKELENLELVEKIKRYSVDSLGYKPTQNFTRIYNQHKSGLLWVITACNAYSFDAYEWSFPIVGRVSYKGYFKKELAQKEYNHLRAMGYDVDMRAVSAWSTLGWFNDPLLSSMLNRSKGGLCNLLFHELFHATYYAPNSVDFNENIASFVAHKATLLFLKSDSAALKSYIHNNADNSCFNNFMLRQTAGLDSLYHKIARSKNREQLKFNALYSIADSIGKLPLSEPTRYLARKADILSSKNACFIDFKQYDSLQDSLEEVFNKIYRGNLKKLVQDLKLNRINY